MTGTDEAARIEIAKLRWRCRRGMRELDLMMGGWLENHYANASPDHQAGFRLLLDCPDPEIHAWLMGRGRPDSPDLAQAVDNIRGTQA